MHAGRASRDGVIVGNSGGWITGVSCQCIWTVCSDGSSVPRCETCRFSAMVVSNYSRGYHRLSVSTPTNMGTPYREGA